MAVKPEGLTKVAQMAVAQMAVKPEGVTKVAQMAVKPEVVKKVAQMAVKMKNNSYTSTLYLKLDLPYNVAVIQWITPCHKNRMTTCVHVTSLTTSVSIMCFLIEIIFILKAIKAHLSGSYDKQNLTLVVISYKIYETRRRLVS